MSAHLTIYCATCEVYGPDIVRAGSIRLSAKWPRFHPDFDYQREPENSDVQGQWGAFLDEHEWHQLELKHE